MTYLPFWLVERIIMSSTLRPHCGISCSCSHKSRQPRSVVRCFDPQNPVTSVNDSSVNKTCSFRPCIDIHKGQVKQIVGSSLSASSSDNLVTNFTSDQPAEYYASLYKQDDLPGGHIIMLGADDESRAAAKKGLLAYNGFMQIGGGVNPDNAAEWLDSGASHLIVTSYIFQDGELNEDRLKELVKAVGRDRLVLDLSCKKHDGKYHVATDRWQKISSLAVDEQSLTKLGQSCAEFLVHGIDVEGKQSGIDGELVELLADQSPIPVTYAGGVSSMDDVELINRAGQGRVDVTIGSALDLFGGPVSYAEVVFWHLQQRSSS
ncbi:TPA: Phosphoribosylformimino-5-aminoimidazole carboxamide ribotide isomerase [Trebouxia sp. C0004]